MLLLQAQAIPPLSTCYEISRSFFQPWSHLPAHGSFFSYRSIRLRHISWVLHSRYRVSSPSWSEVQTSEYQEGGGIVTYTDRRNGLDLLEILVIFSSAPEENCRVHFMCGRVGRFDLDLIEADLYGDGVDPPPTAGTIGDVDAESTRFPASPSTGATLKTPRTSMLEFLGAERLRTISSPSFTLGEVYRKKNAEEPGGP